MDHEYLITFSEDDYWAIYDPPHKKNSNAFNHRSTLPFLIAALITACLATASLAGLSSGQQRKYAELIAGILILTFVLVIVFIIKAYVLQKELGKIKKYYLAVKNGVTITLNKTNIIFKIAGNTEIINWNECKEAVLTEKYIQFNFYEKSTVLIPKGKECISTISRLEKEILDFSERSNEITI